MSKKAIHCETKEEFRRVLEDFDKKGWSEISGFVESAESLIDTFWHERGDNTISLRPHFFFEREGYFERKGYKIIKAKDYLGGNMKYKKGDVLVDLYGKKVKILGVCGDVYFLSGKNSFKSYWLAYTQRDLDENDYKLKEEKTIEVDGKKYSESTLKEAIKEYTN